MLLNLTDLSDEPLQGQIVRQIRAKILAGDLKAGENLPSIRELSRNQHVSVITVQRAYESLVRDNFIHPRRGKGFFVSKIQDEEKKKLALNKFQSEIEPIIEIAFAEGLSLDEITVTVNKLLTHSIEFLSPDSKNEGSLS